jgi:hypothetical protein
MTPAAGPFLVAAVLLVAGGALKFRRPNDTVNAMKQVGWPAKGPVVRAGSLLEVGLGAAALATGDAVVAALLAASYLGFAVFVAVALAKRAPIASCGCFGRAETPASALHVVVNLGAAAAGFAVALDPGASIDAVVSSQPYLGIPFVMLLVIATLATFLVLSTLPQLQAVVRSNQT